MLLISVTKQNVLLPFYHKVTNDKNTFAEDLYKPRKIIDFKNDLDVFNKYYTSIALESFVNISKEKKNQNQKYFHLTFDDGLSNFYTVVAPILLKKKTHATIFVNTDFIDNKALFYRYKASLLNQYYKSSTGQIKSKFHDFFNQKKSIQNRLFSINYNTRKVLDDLAAEVNYSFEAFLEQKKPYLSSKQIQELIDMGFTIGAHSKNHPLYSDLLFEQQIKQTTESLDVLIKKFNLTYKAFSFPHTDFKVTNDFFIKLTKEQKLDISFGTSGLKKDRYPSNFQRLVAEIDKPNFEQVLIFEYIKYLLKIPLGKNIMPRN